MSLPDDYHHVNADLLRLLPADARLIVEVGCRDTTLAESYHRINPRGRYLGIPLPGQTTEADPGIDEGSVDCLVYANSLEQQRDPWSLLRRHTAWLRPGGVVLACIANVQHWAMIRHLLQGQWSATDQGAVRFFTLDGILELFRQAGLEVFDVQGHHATGPDFEPFQQRIGPAVQALGVDPGRFALLSRTRHYIVRAIKAGGLVRPLFIHTLIKEPHYCARVRVLQPNQLLNTIPGVQTSAVVDSVDVPEPPAGHSRVYILQRGLLIGQKTLRYLGQFIEQGWLLLAEWDDDPQRWPRHEEDNYLSLRAYHGVQTTTEPLAACMRQYNPNVAVFPNQLAALPPPRRYAEDGRVRLFFGAVNRDEDWPPLLPALNRVLARHGRRVEVHVIYDRPFFEALQTEAKTFQEPCRYPRYEEILRGCDIALLPLQPTRFNQMKSDLKFVECAGHGVAALASPTVYAGSIIEGESGFLFHSPEQFEERLRQLIEDGELRRRVAGNAYRWVAEHRLLSQYYRQRYEWYLHLLDRLPELNAELRRRAPELFA
jgi:glycosyltransferase involved in cell wall biosynthesis